MKTKAAEMIEKCEDRKFLSAIAAGIAFLLAGSILFLAMLIALFSYGLDLLQKA